MTPIERLMEQLEAASRNPGASMCITKEEAVFMGSLAMIAHELIALWEAENDEWYGPFDPPNLTAQKTKAALNALNARAKEVLG